MLGEIHRLHPTPERLSIHQQANPEYVPWLLTNMDHTPRELPGDATPPRTRTGQVFAPVRPSTKKCVYTTHGELSEAAHYLTRTRYRPARLQSRPTSGASVCRATVIRDHSGDAGSARQEKAACSFPDTLRTESYLFPTLKVGNFFLSTQW